MNNLKTIYNNEFKVVSSDSLNAFNSEFIEYTKKSLEQFKMLFGVSDLTKLEFVLFDDLEKYRGFYREESGKQAPEYSRGCFGKNRILMVIEPPLVPGTEYFMKKRASGAHEAFHIYYRDLIYKKPENRIVWFDEGIAQFFSGQKDYMNEEQFFRYYSNFKKQYKPITNLNDRVQGNSNVPDEKIFKRDGIIDGYSISYLAIRYLMETKGIDFIREIMSDNNRIIELGNTITTDMISYYDAKLQEREDETK